MRESISEFLYVIMLTMLLASCASTPQTPGETASNKRLAQDTINTISIYSLTRHGCSSITVIDTKQIKTEGEIKGDMRGRIVSGDVVEEWTVDQCGTIETYNVKYKPDGKGGTFIGVTPPE